LKKCYLGQPAGTFSKTYSVLVSVFENNLLRSGLYYHYLGDNLVTETVITFVEATGKHRFSMFVVNETNYKIHFNVLVEGAFYVD
jgi:hypothetical protein